MITSGGAVLRLLEQLWQSPLIEALAARAGFTQASQLLLPATLTLAAAGCRRGSQAMA